MSTTDNLNNQYPILKVVRLILLKVRWLFRSGTSVSDSCSLVGVTAFDVLNKNRFSPQSSTCPALVLRYRSRSSPAPQPCFALSRPARLRHQPAPRLPQSLKVPALSPSCDGYLAVGDTTLRMRPGPAAYMSTVETRKLVLHVPRAASSCFWGLTSTTKLLKKKVR